MAPTDECLDTGEHPSGEIDGRLVLQEELAGQERAAQVHLQMAVVIHGILH